MYSLRVSFHGLIIFKPFLLSSPFIKFSDLGLSAKNTFEKWLDLTSFIFIFSSNLSILIISF